MSEKRTVGDWHIYRDPPPIPVRDFDWHFYHDDYDGAPDANDNRHGSAASFEACLVEIIEREAEALATTQVSLETAELRIRELTREPDEAEVERAAQCMIDIIPQLSVLASAWGADSLPVLFTLFLATKKVGPGRYLNVGLWSGSAEECQLAGCREIVRPALRAFLAGRKGA